MRYISRAALLSVLVALLSACATVKAPDKPIPKKGDFSYAKEYLSWMIEREAKKHNIVGLSVVLVAKDRVVWQRGFGFADKKQGLRANDNTLFRAGSLAKMLNAVAILQLYEQGRLDIDTPVESYLAGFRFKQRQPGPPVTLRDILSHQARLPSDLIKGMWVKEPEHFSKALDYLQAVYLTDPPGKVVTYSNLGHDLIGAVIENVTGQAYELYMQQLLDSLSMFNSGFTASPLSPRVAQGYFKGIAKEELSLRDTPAAGLTTSTSDLAMLLKHFLADPNPAFAPALDNESMSLLMTDHSSQHPLNFGKRVGLGLFYYDNIFHNRVRVLGHGGATVNHRSVIKFAPEHGYGVAILSNSRDISASLHRIANKSLALLHEAIFESPAPVKHRFWPSKRDQDDTRETSILGHYATQLGLATIYRDKNKLKAKIAGRTLTLYQRQEGGLFYLKYKLFGIFPIKIGAFGHMGIGLRKVEGKEILVGINTHGKASLLGEKIYPNTISTTWANRVGPYRVVNPLEVIDLPSGGIKIHHGFLIAYAKTERGDPLEVVLQPVNDREAIVAGIGRGLGETVFVTNHAGKEQLRFANIVFERK